MTIWILAVVLLASLAGLGYRQGAVRVAFSFVGILVAALFAVPLGHLVSRLFSLVGLKNPLLLWTLPPFVMFCVVLAAFKIAGLAVHKKVEVYFKYHAGELRIALWERLSRRVGLCLGIANGLAYLVLLSFVIYASSYWTVQVSGATSESRVVRTLNSLGKDLEATGLSKVAAAVDRMPAAYYAAADVAGLVYHNYSPRLAARLANYPAFLSLGERPEFQQLASDNDFIGLWQQRTSLAELLKEAKVKAILGNPDLVKALWARAEPNLADLTSYLATGVSAAFGDERIIGRWDFDVPGAIGAFRKAKPGVSSSQMQVVRRSLEANFKNATFVATPQQEVFLKNVPPTRAAAGAPVQLQTYTGQWKSSGSRYELNLSVEGRPETATAEIQGARLSFTLDGREFVFAREN